MRYTGLQPQYFPRLHYFARILNTNIFMIRDDVQFVKKHAYPDGKTGKSFQADTPIKQSTGMQFLSIPTKHEGFQSIKETKVSYNTDWTASHVKALQFAYAKAANFKSVFPQIENLLLQNFGTVAQLNIATVLWSILILMGEFSIPLETLTIAAVNAKLKQQKKFPLKEIKLGSKSKALVDHSLGRNEKIISLMEEVGADEDYCGGTAMSAYMDLEEFKKHDIKVTIQEWKCSEYPQLFNKRQGFIEDLSIIDLFMNASPEERLEVIKKGVIV
jgi:hypothetical protein